jgi:hypothetical protein
MNPVDNAPPKEPYWREQRIDDAHRFRDCGHDRRGHVIYRDTMICIHYGCRCSDRAGFYPPRITP